MKYWEIAYYRSPTWVHKKYIVAKSANDAIGKAHVKYIVDMVEISKEEYEKRMG